eukprot:GHVS01097899.1.p1 GENE.GHVS01097899.1~~GHVS01097899.1.p1  ORF type:complete len:110 (+),score=17.76 GHVS01097899.1:151-480(+)
MVVQPLAMPWWCSRYGGAASSGAAAAHYELCHGGAAASCCYSACSSAQLKQSVTVIAEQPKCVATDRTASALRSGGRLPPHWGGEGGTDEPLFLLVRPYCLTPASLFVE